MKAIRNNAVTSHANISRLGGLLEDVIGQYNNDYPSIDQLAEGLAERKVLALTQGQWQWAQVSVDDVDTYDCVCSVCGNSAPRDEDGMHLLTPGCPYCLSVMSGGILSGK